MEIRTEETWGLGVSIHSKKIVPIFNAIEELMNKFLTFKEYDYLLVVITVVDECEKVFIPKKQNLQSTFIVECIHPISKFRDLFMDERVVKYAEILLIALYKFYEHHGKNKDEVDNIKFSLITDGIISNIENN